jgi:hypothetical protein
MGQWSVHSTFIFVCKREIRTAAAVLLRTVPAAHDRHRPASFAAPAHEIPLLRERVDLEAFFESVGYRIENHETRHR